MNDVELMTRQERLQELQTATKHRTETLGSWAVPVLTAFLLCAIIAAVALGSVTISAEQVLAVLSAKLTGSVVPESVPPAMTDIIWDIRIPRVILAALVGDRSCFIRRYNAGVGAKSAGGTFYSGNCVRSLSGGGCGDSVRSFVRSR